jgi:glucose/arabinose dehydrogenase
MRRSVLGVTAVLLAVTLPATAGAVKKRLVGNFDTPIQVFAPSGVPGSTIYVVEKGGRIIRRQRGGHRNVVLDIRGQVSGGNEQGLLSAVIHRRSLFVYFTNLSGDSRVVRYRLTTGRGRVTAGSRHVILRVDQPADNHNGGTLQFHRGRLYLSLGDGGGGCDTYHNAQNLHSKLGKLLRHDSNGWRLIGYGLRNPWRWSFDRKTGDLYIGDVGQDAWEEIDYLPAAKVARPAENYGWNKWEGNVRSSASGCTSEGLKGSGELIFPGITVSHPTAEAIIGGYVYRGSAMPGQRGRYFFGDEIGNWVRTADSVTLNNQQTLGFHVSHLSSFGEGSNGDLYAVSLDGPVYKLVRG